MSFAALGDGADLLSAPLDDETEITGPLAARLFVSSSTADADLFLVFRVFTPDLREVVFQGAIDPHTPVAQGWLRASHRKLDPDALDRPYRPYHTHDELQPLDTRGSRCSSTSRSGRPASWCRPAIASRSACAARITSGRQSTGAKLSNFKNELRGCGPFLHDDPRDRPASVFGGENTLHAGPAQPSYILIPVIPPKS